MIGPRSWCQRSPKASPCARVAFLLPGCAIDKPLRRRTTSVLRVAFLLNPPQEVTSLSKSSCTSRCLPKPSLLTSCLKSVDCRKALEGLIHWLSPSGWSAITPKFPPNTLTQNLFLAPFHTLPSLTQEEKGRENERSFFVGKAPSLWFIDKGALPTKKLLSFFLPLPR